MSKHPKGEKINGWINFHKPYGMTSTQAVAYIKRSFNAQKAGHGGTLDPLARGVLPIALGEATKTMAYSLEANKKYTFTVTFGEQRNTDDCEGEAIKTSPNRPTPAELTAALPQFTGQINQLPPIYSALKIDGKPAYTRARKGEEVEVKPRPVTIHSLEVISTTKSKDAPEDKLESATLFAHTSKGTYVRSLARDLGETLGCYGYVSQLIRNQAGPFHLDEALEPETLDNCIQSSDNPNRFLKPVSAVLADIPAYVCTPAEARQLRQGKTFMRVHIAPGLKQVVTQTNDLVALTEVDTAGKFKILRVFN